MKENSRILIKLLSKAIRNQEPDWDEITALLEASQIHWPTLYEEALAHQVHTLIYPMVSKLKNINPSLAPDPTLFSQWKKETQTEAIRQIQQVQMIKEILKAFYKEKIPAIVLKGLLLREYYPNPDLRTMGDADLLTHAQDRYRIKKILKQFDFIEYKVSSKHISYINKNHPFIIEVHNWLSDSHPDDFSIDFEKALWKDTINISLLGAPTMALSVDHHLLHLIIHMKNHIISAGFGLRQLCDFVVFMEANEKELNWDYILRCSQQLQLKTFMISLFLLCNQLFDLKIPRQVTIQEADSSETLKDQRYLDLFVRDILDSGVYGRRNPDRPMSSLLIRYSKPDHPSGRFGRVKKMLQFYFPSSKNLSNRYPYAKKYPFLLIFAWFHRAFTNLSRIGKYKVSPQAEKLSQERVKLLQWLQIQKH